jgi:hypothetical protein
MISGFLQITPSDVSQTSTTKNGVMLGAKAIARDGTIYRWTLNGAVNLADGVTVAAIARVANHTNLVVVSNAAIGATKVTVTLGGTAATADQYIDGTLVINDGTGAGQDLLITGNSAQTSTTSNVDVYLAEPLTVAITAASSKATLQPNQNISTVIAPAAATSVVVGTTPSTVTAANYFWAQTRGMASVLSDGVIAKNTGFIASASVAGAVVTEATGTITVRLGYAPDATVDTKYYPVFLQVD